VLSVAPKAVLREQRRTAEMAVASSQPKTPRAKKSTTTAEEMLRIRGWVFSRSELGPWSYFLNVSSVTG
jgi:hypothetical protein